MSSKFAIVLHILANLHQFMISSFHYLLRQTDTPTDTQMDFETIPVWQSMVACWWWWWYVVAV